MNRRNVFGGLILSGCGLAMAMLVAGCQQRQPTSDSVQAQQQEVILQEGTAMTGMPGIRNFRERKQLKMIYELRDQEGFVTHTYIVAQQTGKPVYLCQSFGYPINDATGYTNPEKVMRNYDTHFATMPQAEPNGLFTPDASDAYWVMCNDPEKNKPVPVFVSGQVVVSPFKLP